MDKHPSAPATLEDALRQIRELREEVARHDKLFEEMSAYLQLRAKLGVPAKRLLQDYLHLQIEQQRQESWKPAHAAAGAIESAHPSDKFRKVEVLQTNPREIVAKLRATWLAQFYINHLKRFAPVHSMIRWLWRVGYPIYINRVAVFFSNRKSKRWRPLTKLSEFAGNNGIPTFKLTDAVLVDTPAPKVVPACDQVHLAPPRDPISFPELTVATISNAVVSGGTNLILAGGEVICHDLYDFERDSTSEELHGRTLIDPGAKRIRWLLHDNAPEPIPVAAAFIDACALNYAHWMTEVLPRIALFCAEERFKDVPIVVNEGLHPNIMESLNLVAGTEREFIALPIGRALAVEKLYATSAAGYVPFGRRSDKLPDHSHGVFNSHAFEILRNQLTTFGQKIEGEDWPEKIYLRRNSGARKVVNADAIEKLLTARGYIVVEPEKLTFLQQVELFVNAKEIVSSTGAALANAICCKPGARVVVLMSKHNDMIYRYWNNLLSPLGIKVGYILGNIVENVNLGIHGDFAVDVDCIGEMLDGFKNE